MSSVIAQNIVSLKKELPSEVSLVAVSKFKPNEDIMQAYDAGQRIFGESRPQELKAKAEELPKDIRWHFIGNLQSNKIKMVVPYAELIHSVESAKLLFEIEKYCRNNGYKAEVLLEFHIATEESKHGFSKDEALAMLAEINAAYMGSFGGETSSGDAFAMGSTEVSALQSVPAADKRLSCVTIRGVMSMASFTDDESLIRSEFATLNAIYDEIKALGYPFLDRFDIKSFGMTGDYHIAVEMGSNMVRIGTKIFGARGVQL